MSKKKKSKVKPPKFDKLIKIALDYNIKKDNKP